MTAKETKFAIGVDLGGTKIEVGIVDETGNIHEKIRIQTNVDEGEHGVQNQLIETIQQLRKKNNVKLEGIGVGVAGQIDQKTGDVIFSPNLNWHNVPLKINMEKLTGLSVQMTNDVRAIALGEWLFGSGQGYQDLVCLFLGTGIGSGIVSGGKLLIGCSNTCGELGHMTIDFNGPICTCGNTGCLEAFAGGWGIAARAQDYIIANQENADAKILLKSVNNQIQEITSKVIYEASKNGNQLANLIIKQAQRAIIAGCISIINAFNPCLLILGGGLIDGMPEWIPLITDGIHKGALKAATQHLKVVKSKLGQNAGIIGSASLIFNQ